MIATATELNNTTDNLDSQILKYLSETSNSELDSFELASELKKDHQKVVGSIKSLHSLGDVIDCEQVTRSQWQLTDEGKSVVESGSHEAKVWQAVDSTDGSLQSQIISSVQNAKIGFSKAMSNGWLRIDKKAEGGPRVYRKCSNIEDEVQKSLLKLQNLSDSQKAELKKRKLIVESKLTTFLVRKGSSFTLNISKPETDLTADMMASGSWKTATFKPYNFEAKGIMPSSGYLHPLQKVRSEFRRFFLEMGFTEMPTNNFIESSFWNFDALFQPQQHPARDAHDTFFIADPAVAKELGDADYIDLVAKVHSEGGFGSQGYKYNWKLSEAKKNILRTHTTAVTARMLYALAQRNKKNQLSMSSGCFGDRYSMASFSSFTPAKYFSIDRVFRNETLDATHLAEFHQVEGVVVDFGLTLGHLMGIIKEFFTKLGMPKIRFKPAYNPYTEPSMEIFAFHEGLKKWIEIGNSGVFRPEMLAPMGLPPEVSAIAWGLSLERPTMILFGIDNIRDLIGPKVNLQMIQSNPLCRLDKTISVTKSSSSSS